MPTYLVNLENVKPIRKPEDTDPKKLEACRAYACMMNKLDYTFILDWLHEDLKYSSAWVRVDMLGKDNYIEYIKAKFDTIKKTGSRVWAEIAYTDAFGAGPCVVLAQGSPENLIAPVLITMREEKISEMSMSIIPSPGDCRRTGEYPGIES